jgi:hypothetical protein
VRHSVIRLGLLVWTGLAMCVGFLGVLGWFDNIIYGEGRSSSRGVPPPAGESKSFSWCCSFQQDRSLMEKSGKRGGYGTNLPTLSLCQVAPLLDV